MICWSQTAACEHQCTQIKTAYAGYGGGHVPPSPPPSKSCARWPQPPCSHAPARCTPRSVSAGHCYVRHCLKQLLHIVKVKPTQPPPSLNLTVQGRRTNHGGLVDARTRTNVNSRLPRSGSGTQGDWSQSWCVGLRPGRSGPSDRRDPRRALEPVVTESSNLRRLTSST